MNDLDENLQKFLEWLDSHREPDGSIILSKHPDLCAYFRNEFNPKKLTMQDLNKITGLGKTIDFDLSSRYCSEDKENE